MTKTKVDIGFFGYGICSLLMGGAIFYLLPGTLPWVLLFGSIGAGSIAAGFITQDKMTTLFKNCNLVKGEMRPELQETKKTEYSTIYRYSVPVGLSFEDFEKCQPAIEQFLGHKVKITPVNKNILIEVFETELKKCYPFQSIDTKGPVEFPIGYQLNGKILTCDLSSGEPHMLVAGETGSGKSVFLRSLITYIILNKKITLHLIDLKRGAEFNVFRKSSQVQSFARNADEAEELLCKISEEVDRRYDLFFDSDVADIKEYNKKGGKLNYQVVIIDEFAEVAEEKKTISLIESISARSRACGIHLILATQRPCAKTITGKIKANVATVMGLKTTDDVNSRIIIDAEGLEQLRGQGHGIFKRGALIEVQALYLTTDEARKLVQHTYINKPAPKKQKPVDGQVSGFGFLDLV